MKCNFIIAGILLVFCSLQVKAQTFTQYFDGADTLASKALFIVKDTNSSNIWQIGIPRKTIFKAASTVPNAILTDTVNNYSANDSSSFSIKIGGGFLVGSILAVRWVQKLDFEKHRDGGIVEFSKNGGVWQNIFNNPAVFRLYGFNQGNKDTLPNGQYAFSGRDTTWRDIWLCLSGIGSNDSVQVRFTIKSDSANNYEGWMIDNMRAQRTLVHTVKKVEPGSRVKVFPTNTTGVLHIEAEHLQQEHFIQSIQITDATGKLVQEYHDRQDRFLIDIGHFPPGLYYVSVTTNLGNLIEKVLLRQ